MIKLVKFLPLLPMAALGALFLAPAASATMLPSPLYAYNFDNATSSGVANDGTVSGATLNMRGDWADSGTGVAFSNDLTSNESSADWTPATGETLDIPGDDTASIGAQFKFSNYTGSCSTVNPHIAAVGRDVPQVPGQVYDGEMKIQLCQTSGDVFVQCRIAGESDHSETPLTSSLALVENHDYNVECSKSGDNSVGGPVLTLSVTRDETGVTTTDSKDISASGHILIDQPNAPNNAVSVGNKTPRDSQANNVDGYNGIIYTADVCDSTSQADADFCTDSEFQSLP